MTFSDSHFLARTGLPFLDWILTLSLLKVSALGVLAEVTKTSTFFTGNNTLSMPVQLRWYATASLIALSYQDHLTS